MAKEAKEICEELNIEDVNSSTMTKSEFKRLMKGALDTRNETMMKEQATNKLKCRIIMQDDYGKKEYMNEKKIEEVRLMFKTRVGLLPFAGNFSHDKSFSKSNWLCRCGMKENQSHITSGSCQIYEDIWRDRGDLRNDEDLVKFFSAVLERRSLLVGWRRRREKHRLSAVGIVILLMFASLSLR